MTAQTESPNRLHGRWFLIARLAWVIMFLTLTAMYALGFRAVRDVLSTVCEQEQCKLVQQIRQTDAGEKIISWPGPSVGSVERLRPNQVQALERLGLTLDQYGLLGALQLGLPALILLLIAAGLFWWKSDDWMVLFASIMVATFPIHNTPLPFTLMVHQPAWEWVYNVVSIVALSCLWIFFLIFPNGQFVPRWTRWMAIYEVGGAVIGAFFGDTIREVRGVTLFFGVVFLLPSFCIGAYAQLYRYFRVARPAERQQFKWVAFGLVGFVVTQFAMLIPLNALLTSAAANADPERALVLSAIPDTLWQLNNLLIAVCIVISVLRYRLWDIDILINRSLVYGALTASVVGLYVLIVGGLGTFLQTQNNLPGIVIALLLIAFLFQPLRQRLQDIVNRFVPVPQAVNSQSIAAPAPQTKQEQNVAVTDSAPNTTLRGRWLILARAIWITLTFLILGIIIAAIPALLQELVYESHTHLFSITLRKFGVSVDFYITYNLALEILRVVGFISVAVIIFWRKSDDWMALFTSLMLVLLAPNWSFPRSLLIALSAVQPEWNFTLDSLRMIGLGSFAIFLFLFPDGRIIPRWTRILAAWILTWPFIHSLSPSRWESNYLLSSAVHLGLFGTGLLAQIYRYRRFSGPIERQQTKWVVYGFATTVLVSFAVSLPAQLIQSLWIPNTTGLRYMLMMNSVIAFASLLMPISIGISILRYRLWDIDIFINRSLVYGALIVSVIGLYMIVVGVAGALFQSVGNPLLAILATGLIAVIFHPLRQRLQRGINRLMYGDRDDPYAALSRLGRRLEASLAPEAVLPTVVTTVRDVLKLPYVAIYLQQDPSGYKIVAESASRSLRSENGRIVVPGMNQEGLCIPLIHQGETLGYIVLGPRAPTEAFNSTDLRLLDDLTPQVGSAVHAVRLTADLQRSRERLVLAREEERRRLRRDLHDGLGPQLAGLTLKLEAARNRLTDDPLADSLLADLAKRTQDATADIRRLVYELRPPTLDELGLVSALREGAAQYSHQGLNSVHITIDTPDSLPPLPAAVEVAVYRITQEALTNVLRHAEAHTCKVELRLNEQMNFLCLEIQDDGRGLSSTRRAGVGLNSMRERAEELGGTWTIESLPTGGTRILVRLPYRLPDEPLSTIPEEK